MYKSQINDLEQAVVHIAGCWEQEHMRAEAYRELASVMRREIQALRDENSRLRTFECLMTAEVG